jgi:hypothetical protein
MRRRSSLLIASAVIATAVVPLATTAQADSVTSRCVVTAGSGETPADATGVVGYPASLGGCLLVTLPHDATVTAVQTADGCRLAAATDPSGGFNSTADVGQRLPAGSRVWALCDAGVVNASNAVTLDDGATPAAVPGWSTPAVVTSGNLFEPAVVGDDDGRLYYSPTNKIFRSDDGGASWTDVSPPVPTALPTYFSDTTTSVAADGSVWWSRTWGDLDSTLTCVTTDHGDSWTCNNNALPGITDRPWLFALSSTEAVIESSSASQQPVWLRTTDSGQTWLPYATSTEHGLYGNIVQDPANGHLLQLFIDLTSATLRVMDVTPTSAPQMLTSRATGIPRIGGLPYVSYGSGYLWATGEPAQPDGSRTLTVARSSDDGVSWQQLPVTVPADSVALSAVSAGADGQVTAVFYGSDVAAAPTANGGHWSLYAAVSADGTASSPTWAVSVLAPSVHTGSVCWAAGCNQTGSDPNARFAGDFTGPWTSRQGQVFVPFVRDEGTNFGYDELTKSVVPAPSGS